MGSTVSKVDKGEGRVSELGDTSVALPKWKDNEKENGKKGTEYPRAVVQLQKVIITCKMAVPDGG